VTLNTRDANGKSEQLSDSASWSLVMNTLYEVDPDWQYICPDSQARAACAAIRQLHKRAMKGDKQCS
jgi:hypothetical protein